MSQNLRLVLKSAPAGHRYNASGGLLTLRQEGTFVVTIQQFTDEIARIDRQIQEQVAHNNSEYQKYLNVYNKKAEGGWTPAEVEQQRANEVLRERTQQRAQGAVNTLNAQKVAAFNRYHNVSWCWQIVGTGIRQEAIAHNTSFDHGIEPDGDSVHFPKLLEGGGLCWLEAFRETADPATGSLPYGMYVRATGTPKILRCEWTDPAFNPIEGVVGFGSEVLLHVYTEGLFGQELKVGLMDRDLFSFNDPLPIANAAAFTTEVNVKKTKPFEVGKPGTGGLLTKDNATETDRVKTENFVQKVVIPVLVDPAWESDAGMHLLIYPVVMAVRDNQEFEGFERAYLEVKKGGRVLDDPAAVYTNNPVLIGEIETDPAVFHPCKYEQIKFAPVPETETEKARIIFDKARQEAQLLTVPIICPDIDHMQDYAVELLGLSVTECRLAGSPGSHQNSTFNVLRPPANFRVAHQTPEKLSFKAAFNYHPANDTTLEGLSLKMLQYIWPASLPRDNQHPLEVTAQTCRYSRLVKVLPYPDVKWTFDLRFGMKGPRVSTHTNLPTDDRSADPTTGRPNSRYSTAQDDARRSGTVNNRGFMLRSEGMELEFQLSLSADYNKGEKIELAAKYEAKVSKFLELLVSLKNNLDTVTNIKAANKGFRNGVRSLGRLLKSPVRGSIDYPVISIGGSWQAAINNQLEVYTTGSVSLKFTPLLKASVSLDIIAAASYVPPLKPAVMAVERAFAVAGGEINFLLTLFGQLDVNFEYMFSNSGGSNLNLAGAIGLKLELSANVRVNMNAVFFQVAGEVSASGVAVTSIEPRASIGHDDKGTFVDAHCDFKGVKIVATFSATGGASSVQYEDTYVVVEEVPDFWKGRADLFSASPQHS